MESLLALFTQQIGLNENHWAAFCDQLKTKNLKKKEHLISEGTVCDFIGFVSSETLGS